MHSCEREMQTRDSSTPSASSTEDLMGSGVRGNYNKQQIFAVVSHAEDSQHIYEDIDLTAPPKLAPSGVYTKGNSIIKKPIAFKPVLTSALIRHRFSTPITSSSPFSSTESSDATSNTGNMKHSTKSTLSQSQYSLSQHSYFLEDDNWYSEIAALKVPHTPGITSVGSGAGHGSTYDLAAQTPSPSDSGIAELEAMLREKDSEISYLRETLEQNEQVIFKVYEEKEQAWQREFKKLRTLYESKLRTTQHKISKAEHTLQVQNQQIQMEKRKLLTELEDSKQLNESTETQLMSLQTELSTLRSQLEETEWSLCQKSGEIALLKSQLKESQGDQTSRTNELLALRSQLREVKCSAEEKTLTLLKLEERMRSSNCNTPDSTINMENTIEKLQNQVRELLNEREENENRIRMMKQENSELNELIASCRDELDLTKEQIEEEKVQWFEEKEKVIRYQKQLQSNYMNMLRRNKTLEYQVQQMSVALHKEHTDDGTESQC